MKPSKSVQIFVRASLMCLFFVLSLCAANAQSAQGQKMQMPMSHAAGNGLKPMSKGAMAQMGRMSKKQRMDAAIRHANKRAEHIRKNRKAGVK